MFPQWAFFQDRFFWIEFESGPHVYPVVWDRVACQCLLKVQLNTFTDNGSDLLPEPQEDHHLDFKIPLIAIR